MGNVISSVAMQTKAAITPAAATPLASRTVMKNTIVITNILFLTGHTTIQKKENKEGRRCIRDKKGRIRLGLPIWPSDLPAKGGVGLGIERLKTRNDSRIKSY
jgi:hypothetical protein